MSQSFNRFRTSVAILLAVVCLTSCNRPNNTPQASVAESAPIGPIRVAVIADAELSEAINREWHATAESEIEIINLQNATHDDSDSIDADVIVFAANYIGQLASNTAGLRIRAIPFSKSERQQIKLNDVMPLTRQHEMTWGKQLYALTIGSPQFCLIVRRDVFELFDLKLPTTWAEYQQVVEKLTAEQNQNSIAKKLESDGAVVGEPLSNGWAAKTFLTRAAAYAKNPNEFSCLFSIIDFSPRIASPPFERALDELRETLRIGGDRIDKATPHTLMERIATGRLAMVLSWPTAWRSDDSHDVVPLDIGASPGSDEFYNRTEDDWVGVSDGQIRYVPLTGISGRFAAISSGGSIREAKNFLTWLAAPGNSVVTSRSSETAPFRNSQRKEIAQWLPSALEPISQQYFDILESSQTSAVSLTYPRFANQHRYMQALDQAIRDSFDSTESSKEILTKVADQWRAITEDLGQDVQLASYLESLNINHTKR